MKRNISKIKNFSEFSLFLYLFEMRITVNDYHAIYLSVFLSERL